MADLGGPRPGHVLLLLPRHFLSDSAGDVAVLAVATWVAVIVIVAVLWGARVVLSLVLMRSADVGVRIALYLAGAIGIIYDCSVYPRGGSQTTLVVLAGLETVLVLAAAASAAAATAVEGSRVA